jgi:hypothetical protein
MRIQPGSNVTSQAPYLLLGTMVPNSGRNQIEMLRKQHIPTRKNQAENRIVGDSMPADKFVGYVAINSKGKYPRHYIGLESLLGCEAVVLRKPRNVETMVGPEQELRGHSALLKKRAGSLPKSRSQV